MKVLRVLLVVLAAFVFVACNRCNDQTEDYEMNEIYGQVSSPICFDTASYIFERLDAILYADNGYHWGISLHGPVVITDAITRYAIANMPDIDGEIFIRQGSFYVGQLPEQTHIGNTASYFGGRLWGMITLGLIEANLDNLDWVVDILLHELFHAKQPLIFEGERTRSGSNPPHLREVNSRISIQLEINALLAALRATGDERLSIVHDALSIRTQRRTATDINAALEENIFEIVEGTAVYTEAALGRENLSDRIALIERNMDIDGYNVVEQFGYHTGALYALLLDEFNIDWRIGLSWEADLAALLKEGIGLNEVIPFDAIDLERYGYSEVRFFQEEWVAETERLTQEAQDAFSGPILLIDATGEFIVGYGEGIRLLFLQGIELYNHEKFDYGQEDIHLLVGERFDERTVFYGSITYVAEFGELQVRGGHLMLWSVMWRHGIPAYSLKFDGNSIIGSNWVLTLNEGFELREVAGGHFRIIEMH